MKNQENSTVKNVDLKKSPSIPKPEVSLYKKDVFNFQNKKIGSLVLNEDFWKIAINRKLIHSIILSQQASWRVNTKKVKTKGEVSGGGKKPWNQKGTGRARHGSIRSPIWKGGGVTFGPTGEENYSKKVNRKVFNRGVRMILADCLKQEKILFWNDVDFVKPSTKNIINLLDVIQLKDKKILFIVDDQKHNLNLSLRNLVKLKALNYVNINPYDLLYFDKILVLDKLLPDIEKRFL